MSAEMDAIRAALRSAIKRKEEKALAGLQAWALLIERRSKDNVPVEYGQLRASGYTLQSGPYQFEVGFSASYALAVHEKIDMKWAGKERRSGIGVYWGPHGEAKFLENALNNSRKEGLALVKGYMKK